MTHEPVLDPADPAARKAQTYPILTPDDVARIVPYGVVESFDTSGWLFRRGDRNVDFFLVLDGEVEILVSDLCGGETPFVAFGPGQFTGELNLLNDRAMIAAARAGAGAKLVRVRSADFRRLLACEAELAETLLRAFILRRVGFIRRGAGGVTLVGRRDSADMIRLQRFLTRNAYPFQALDVEAPDGAALAARLGFKADALPAVVAPAGVTLANPTTAALADSLGLTEPLDPHAVYDVAVVGAGPAGLAAAVYAASEGLKTIVLETLAPGGQAGTSSRIENYLGFPTGVSGQALAGRAQIQAQKFGAHLAVARGVGGLDCSGAPFALALESGENVRARAVVVATGARYRRLDLENYEKFEGAGVEYAATPMEGQLCAGLEAVVVGGGNSAGQAAMFLSGVARHVHIVVRRPDLAATMSDYLVRRIAASPRVTLHAHSEIVALHGDERLRAATWANRSTGAMETREIGALFVMIGAEPNTDWLGGCLALDDKGFVLTGAQARCGATDAPYAASRPGVFAVGDVRSGSTKRVASAVGEGAAAIHAVHAFLHPEA
ncbi:FAD-dependent oxidoreductase [Methylocella sp.]|uniref:FAD-dependent oxidoreductase n=1 Tax=Methylocella sp. TaxID=1978226 RepID=UPI0037838A71